MKHTFTGSVSVELTRRQDTNYPNGGHSWTHVRIGTRTAQINLQVDVDSLIRSLGAKAARSKGRRSRMSGGDIVAEVVSIEDTLTVPT